MARPTIDALDGDIISRGTYRDTIIACTSPRIHHRLRHRSSMEKNYLRRNCRRTYKFFNLEDGRTELVVGEIQSRLTHYGMKSLRTTEEYKELVPVWMLQFSISTLYTSSSKWIPSVLGLVPELMIVIPDTTTPLPSLNFSIS